MILEKYLTPEKVGKLARKQKVQWDSILCKYFCCCCYGACSRGGLWRWETCEEYVTLKVFITCIYFVCGSGRLAWSCHMYMWRSEGDLWKLSLSFYPVGPRYWTWIVRLGSIFFFFYPFSNLISPSNFKKMSTVTSTMWLLWNCKVYTFS